MKKSIFFQMQKVDVAKRQVWGYAAVEEPDSCTPPEIMDYEKSKPHFMAWSDEVQKLSDGKSLGNVRAMHGSEMVAAGRVIHFEPRDGEKAFYVGAEIVDDQSWEKVQKGVYTGFSIGGKYGEKWMDKAVKDAIRYVAIPSEISLADIPAMRSARFEIVKVDGSTEEREFENVEEDEEHDDDPKDPKSGSTESEGDDEEIEKIVITVLERLGLSKLADQVQDLQKQIESATANIAKALQSDDLQKSLTTHKGELQKALDDHKTETESKFEQIVGDIAKVAVHVSDIEKRGGPGPVIRDLGKLTSTGAAALQEAEQLKKVLSSTTNPTVQQEIRNRIAELEIKARQSSQ